MPYLVRLTNRALRDLEVIYEFVEADNSQRAQAWFNELADTIYSLERFPMRGLASPGSKNLRRLLFGTHPGIYKIIYSVDKRNRVINVLHIRHAARLGFPADDPSLDPVPGKG